MDYGKFLFEVSKKQAEAKKKQKQIQIKELKFRPTTEEGDYQVKLRNLVRFLDHGDKVKITLRFRGREVAHHFDLITAHQLAGHDGLSTDRNRRASHDPGGRPRRKLHRGAALGAELLAR